jgi:hypothetical protein
MFSATRASELDFGIIVIPRWTAQDRETTPTEQEWVLAMRLKSGWVKISFGRFS